MRKSAHRSRRYISTLTLAVFFIAFVPWLVGCGTGTYDALVEAKSKELDSAPRMKVSWADLHPYFGAPLADSEINVRVPKLYDLNKPMTEDSRDPDTNSKLDPRTLFPAGVKLPGYRATYEARDRDSEGTEWPLYYYLSAEPMSAENADALEKLRAALKAQAPETPDAWEEVELLSPDRKKMTWKKLRVEAPIFIDHYDSSGIGGFGKQDCILEIYAFEGEENRVLVGWRAVSTFEDFKHLNELAQLSAGSLTINGKTPSSLTEEANGGE